MNDDDDSLQPDTMLDALRKEDLYEMSVGDLKNRISLLEIEINRCKTALESRADTRSEAEKLFKI